MLRRAFQVATRQRGSYLLRSCSESSRGDSANHIFTMRVPSICESVLPLLTLLSSPLLSAPRLASPSSLLSSHLLSSALRSSALFCSALFCSDLISLLILSSSSHSFSHLHLQFSSSSPLKLTDVSPELLLTIDRSINSCKLEIDEKGILNTCWVGKTSWRYRRYRGHDCDNRNW